MALALALALPPFLIFLGFVAVARLVTADFVQDLWGDGS